MKNTILMVLLAIGLLATPITAYTDETQDSEFSIYDYFQIGPTLVSSKAQYVTTAQDNGFQFEKSFTAPQTASAPSAAGTIETMTQNTALDGGLVNTRIMVKNNKTIKDRAENLTSVVGNARSISSISITPRTGKIVTEVENTIGGQSIQEIPSELSPKIIYDSIEIINNETDLTIKEGQIEVNTTQKVVINSDGIYVDTDNTRKKITVFPRQAREIAIEKTRMQPTKISLETRGDTVEYAFVVKETGKIFAIIPTEFEVKVFVDAQTGITKTEKPFWSIFVLK